MGDRDFDPALVVTFNNAAKLLTADDASAAGKRRLLAIGGEEGAIRILDVDQPLESEAPDHWWSAHNNGIFDLKWTRDDDRLVRTSSLAWGLTVPAVSVS
jgi:denticleless